MTTTFRTWLARSAAPVLLALFMPACAQMQAPPQPASAPASDAFRPMVGQPGKDVVWVPTPDEVVEKMLDMAQVKAGDRVVDLGSGDGKIAIAAALRGARARGIEYNRDMVVLSRRNAERANVKVDFEQGDIFEADFREADVVTLYLLPALNVKLRPILLSMKPGTRVTSHSFDMGDWQPDERATLDNRTAYLWRVPANVEGNWRVTVEGNAGPSLQLRQRYQKVEGTVRGAEGSQLRTFQVDGASVRFVIADAAGVEQRFEGTADQRGRMRGTVSDGQGSRPFTAVRR